MKTGQCCAGEGRSRPAARLRVGAAGSLVSGALLVLLPKCPLCLAAWLTAATGIALSAAAAERLRGLLVAFAIMAVVFAALQMTRRRV